MCIIYPQFWLGEVVDRELHMHLNIIKQYWRQPRQNEIIMEKTEWIPELLSSIALDYFWILMVINAQSTMRAIDTHIHPTTKLWRSLSLSSYLTIVFPEYFKLAELALIMVRLWYIFLEFSASKL